MRPEHGPAAARAPERDTLLAALDELAGLGTDQDRERLAALRGRMDAARPRVAVVGEATRGKSTLINALLGQALLPAGETPLTTVVTTVRYGQDQHARVRFLDGHEARHPLAALASLVTGDGNPGHHRHVVSVTVHADAVLLAAGVELVDTPGTGSVLETAASAALGQVLDTADAAVLVLAADPPVSARERGLLEAIASRPMTVFVVLNKADHLDAAGLATVTEFTQRVLSGADHPAPLYPMSAWHAQHGGDPGFAAFAADFTQYLAASRVAELTRSAVTQGRQTATALLADVAAARQSARSGAADTVARTELLSTRLAEAAKSTRDGVTMVGGESARLLFALNDAAESDLPRLRRSIAAQLDAVLNGELGAVSAADVGRLGRERLASITGQAVTVWQQQQQDRISQALSRLDRRLAGDVAAHLDEVRGPAAELLGTGLAPPEPDAQLARIEWRAGPATETAAPSVSSEIDAASTDLRGQLAVATRTLIWTVERRCAGTTGWLQAVRQAADAHRLAATATAGRTERRLAGREQALRGVLGLLEQAGGKDRP